MRTRLQSENERVRATSRKANKPAPARRTHSPASTDLPLRNHAERALSDYFASLNGHRPARLYDMVLREVEEPLFRTVLDYASGNQSQAAIILGITRGTLRKKLREFGLSA
jgi:Fis family transcriptional regulator, factor for inversion stimulation protein